MNLECTVVSGWNLLFILSWQFINARNIYVATSSDSPHILPLSTEPGLQDSKAFLPSRDFGSATIISDDTWKLDSGCLASVLFSRLVSCSSVRRSLL